MVKMLSGSPCLQTECRETEGCVPCKDNTCLAVHQMCDSVFDCPDGSDEAGCEEKVSKAVVLNGGKQR